MTTFTYAVLDDPQAPSGVNSGTEASSINNNGDISGAITVNSGVSQGFILESGNYTNFSDDGLQFLSTGTINNSDMVAGFGTDSQNVDHGYVYDNGVFTLIDDPEAGAAGTFVSDIDDSGAVVGSFFHGGANTPTSGFAYQNGSFTTISDPFAGGGLAGDIGTQAVAINNAGEIVGTYSGDDGLHGFSYQNGVYTTIDSPAPGASNSEVIDVNDKGEIAGEFYDAAGIRTGFTYKDGVYTTISDPQGAHGTDIQAINNEGDLVGVYTDAFDRQHGFFYHDGGFTTIDPPGSTAVLASDINDADEIVGTFRDSSGSLHGFLADPICFCAGARILTALGEKPVEKLSVGDMVMALRQGEWLPVRWIGHARVKPERHRAPAHVYPVRIQAGAFGDGAPNRDLWLTPGHRVFVDGHLVQIDALLNDATIAQFEVEALDVWHVELDRHDVLLANGLAAESFLDVGNSAALGAANVLPLRRDLLATGDGARTCAPVLRDEAALAALRSRLAARAETLGWTLVDEPELCILGGEQRFAPVVENGRYVFHLPQPIDDARLCSRTRVPARMEPGVPDGRRLGVAVARLVVDGEPLALEILGDGWHGGECDAAGEFRWTNGDAALPPGRRFEVEMVHPRRYWANVGPVIAPPPLARCAI